jgi:hypothetical protein
VKKDIGHRETLKLMAISRLKLESMTKPRLNKRIKKGMSNSRSRSMPMVSGKDLRKRVKNSLFLLNKC